MTIPTERFYTLGLSGSAVPERMRVDRAGNILYESVFTPRRVRGQEGIGRLFEYRIEAVTTNPGAFRMVRDNDELDPARLRGTEVTLTIKLDGERNVRIGGRYTYAYVATGAGTREISGYVCEAAVMGVEADTTVHEFVLRPWGWFATLGTNSRVFNGSISNIISDVLKPYEGEIEWRLDRSITPSRDLIRQAWESDWDFCMRLCEEFGFIAWWEHRKGTHVLVIADHSRAFHKQGRPREKLRFHTGGGHIEEEHLTHLEYRNSVTMGKVIVHDHSYLSPRLDIDRTPYREQWAAPYRSGDDKHETYTRADYAQPHTRWGERQDDMSWKQDAQQLARVKLEAEYGARLRAKGRGRLRGIETGKTFRLMHHPHAAANCEYLVLACTLDIHEAGIVSDSTRDYVVDAAFDLHPANEPYRMPQVTPRPRMEGFEYAVIVGPRDAEIYVDEYNRVQIQFAWDRDGKFDGASSIWVRVAQPWQGDQMGTVTHGRCGQQVLVGYVNGDPDRPFVAAFVPDWNNMPAWKLPDNHALTGLVTRRLGYGVTTNHLALDDTRDRQQAQLASDHAKSSLSLGCITRIEGNAGRQDARGEGAELRSDGHVAVRGAGGFLATTFARLLAKGKVKDISETLDRLTQARSLHQQMADIAHRNQAQAATGDQADVAKDIEQANAELRGHYEPRSNEFPEFEKPHLTLASAAGLQAAANDSSHFASGAHAAITAVGNISFASARSLLASVFEKISLYAHRAGVFIGAAFGNVRIHAQTGEMELKSQLDMHVGSEGKTLYLFAADRIVLNAGNSRFEIGPDGIFGYTPEQFRVHAQGHATDGPLAAPYHLEKFAPFPMQLSCAAFASAQAPERPANPSVTAPAPSAGDMRPAGQDAGMGAPLPSNTGPQPARAEMPGAVGADPCRAALQDVPASTVTWDMECANYWGLMADGSAYRDQTTGKQIYVRMAGANGTFDIGFDSASKTITLKVIVLVVPMQVRKHNSAPGAQPEIVPYESARDHDESLAGIFIKEPRPASQISNLREMKGSIEEFMNKTGYKLTLKNCPNSSRHDGNAQQQCAVQIAIRFVIDFVTDPKERHHRKVNLYAQAERADSGNWGEVNVQEDKKRSLWTPIPDEHVQSHEAGHLFSFPDEYFEAGGAIHKSYITSEQVNLPLARSNSNKNMWQGIGETTLMGPGVYKPGVKFPSYYLYRVAAWFEKQTGRNWKVIPHIEA